ncbi:MAG: hypothetical protein EBQ96_03490 [Proteobacteria bacterium]|nr:hypothetical protein [Pseudomonadota bacterium]
MANISVHAASSMATSQSGSNFMGFFHDLPEYPGMARTYFNHWAGLDHLELGALGSRQVCQIIGRTGQAYARHGRDTFGDGFRLALHKERGSWLRHAFHRIGQTEAKDLQFALWGFGKIGLQPDFEYFKKWNMRAIPTMNLADEVDIANSMWAQAVLCLKPFDKYMTALTKRLDHVLPNMSSDSAATLLWSLAVIDSMYPNPEHAVLAKRVFKRFNSFGTRVPSKDNVEELSQVRDACLWFGFKNHHGQPINRGNTRSQLEMDVMSALKRAGMMPLDRRYKEFATLGKEADHAYAVDGTLINMEIDGYTHLIRASDGSFAFSGKTRFQTSLMNKEHPERLIVRLPVDAWEQASYNGVVLDGERLNHLFHGLAANASGATGTPRGAMALNYKAGVGFEAKALTA